MKNYFIINNNNDLLLLWHYDFFKVIELWKYHMKLEFFGMHIYMQCTYFMKIWHFRKCCFMNRSQLFKIWIILSSNWITIPIESLFLSGSQAGVVDINHAFHLFYKCCMWIWVSVDLNLTARVSSQHSGFLPPQNWLLV